MPSTATNRLQGVTTSVAVKPPCITVATTDITLAGLQTISGVVLAEGDRVLVKGQSSAVDNGIYDASTGSWTRALDFDGDLDAVSGTRVLVVSSSSNGVEYELTTSDPIVIGTTSLTFVLRYGANATYDRTEAEINAGVTPTDYAYPPGPVVPPERFGAVGDGVTDDSAAFQAVIDYLAQLPRGGMMVLDTTKSYYWASTLNWADRVWLIGNHAQIIVGSQDPVIDCVGCVGGGFYGVECEIDSGDADYQSTTFFRVRGNSHKLRWDECFIEGFEHAWLLRGCWSMEIARCRGDKSINDISIYRATGEAIGCNDLTVHRCHFLSTYAIRTGDTTLPDADVSGEIGESIRITSTQFDTGKMLFGSQVAGNILIQGCHGELSATTGRVISFEGNHYSCQVRNTTIWGGYEGVYAQDGVRYLTVDGGDFRDMKIGVHANMQAGEAIVENVRWSSNVVQRVAGAVRSSDSRYAECLFGRNADGRWTYGAGIIEYVTEDYPTTGRFPVGSVIKIRHSKNHAIIEQDALSGGSIAGAEGMRTLAVITTTGNAATGSGSTVTGVGSISSLRKGDYVSITGAGAAGVTYYGVIADIDYTNSTFDPQPNCSTASSGATITVMPAALRKTEYASAQPSAGSYRIGDTVWNTGATLDASNMVILGWRRLTTGSSHTAGTDWAVMRVSHVSPAT